eukprot:4099132-Ditylum_brightwellii.AAC.1
MGQKETRSTRIATSSRGTSVLYTVFNTPSHLVLERSSLLISIGLSKALRSPMIATTMRPAIL